MTSPRGITTARPPFVFCDCGQSFCVSSISAVSSALYPQRLLWELFMSSWGGPGCFLAFWSELGPTWPPKLPKMTPRCHPGSLLGPHGHLLGRLGGGQNLTKTTCPKKINFQTPQCRVTLLTWGGFGRPKSIKNATRNESKFKTIFKSEKVALQQPLGAVLGRSWGIFGAIFGNIFVANCLF